MPGRAITSAIGSRRQRMRASSQAERATYAGEQPPQPTSDRSAISASRRDSRERPLITTATADGGGSGRRPPGADRRAAVARAGVLEGVEPRVDAPEREELLVGTDLAHL